MRSRSKNLTDQPRQHLARPDLNEHPRPGVVHRLNLFGEPDRTDELFGQQFGGSSRIVRVWFRGHVREGRQARRRQRDILNDLGEWRASGRHQR